MGNTFVPLVLHHGMEAWHVIDLVSLMLDDSTRHGVHFLRGVNVFKFPLGVFAYFSILIRVVIHYLGLFEFKVRSFLSDLVCGQYIFWLILHRLAHVEMLSYVLACWSSS